MSNFNGWTSEIINKIKLQKIINDSNKKEKNKTVKVKKTHKDYVTPIQKALLSLGIESEKEYKFDNIRRFRFDLALPIYKIAIEFEGGVFSKGGHTRGMVYTSNCDKYNLANDYGWKVYRYTVKHTESNNWEYDIANHICDVINNNIISNEKENKLI